MGMEASVTTVRTPLPPPPPLPQSHGNLSDQRNSMKKLIRQFESFRFSNKSDVYSNPPPTVFPNISFLISSLLRNI